MNEKFEFQLQEVLKEIEASFRKMELENKPEFTYRASYKKDDVETHWHASLAKLTIKIRTNEKR